MADQFENFNRLAEETQQYPMLTPAQVQDMFHALDQLIHQGVRLLLDTTHFVEDNLCHRLAEIAAGSIKTKIYRGRFVKTSRGAGQGVMIGSENSKVLGLGFDLFKLSRMSRDLAVPLVLRVLRSLRLQNINYEQILHAFEALTQDYRKICIDLAAEQQRLKWTEESDENPVVLMKRISDLIDNKKKIESQVGCVDQNLLYGTVAMVHRITKRINRIKDRVVESFMRSIPRVVRKYARSDLDASDLFQVGCFGLMHAVSAYDYRSRAGFAGFSKRWIQQRIQDYRKKSGGPMVRLPPRIWENYQEILRTEARLKHDWETDDISRDDIAQQLGWSVSKVDSVFEKVGFSQIVSLDDGHQEADDFYDREATIADTSDEDQELIQQLQEHVEHLVEHLESDDRRLICLKFGCVELIENDNINPNEVLDEIFRQMACKLLLHRYVAGSIYTVQSLPLSDFSSPGSDASL